MAGAGVLRRCRPATRSFCLADGQENIAVGDPTGTRVIARPFINARTRLPTSELISFPRSALWRGVRLRQQQRRRRADALVRFHSVRAVARRRVPARLSGGLPLPLFCRSTHHPRAGHATGKAERRHGQRGARRLPHDEPLPRRLARRGGIYRRGAFGGADARFDMGEMHRDVLISGSTATTTPGRGTVVTPGGLLAKPTNAGTRHGRLRAGSGGGSAPGLAGRSVARLTAGYSLLVISDVARPGEQIDLQVDPSLLPGATPLRAAA